MKKEQPFFKHDSNAINDPKIIALTNDFGLEGYGAFWMLIELLREEPDYKCSIRILTRLERMYQLQEGFLTKVIRGYNLFVIEDDMFYSPSLRDRLIALDDKKKKLSEAGKRGNEKRWNNSTPIATLSPPDRHPIASLSQDKIRLDKNNIPPISPKGDGECSSKKFIKPDITEIEAYCRERSNGIHATEFFDFYEAKGWKVGKSPMKDWRAAVRTWEANRKNENPQPERQAPKNKLPEGVEVNGTKVSVCGVELPASAYPIPPNAKRWDYLTSKWIV